jgi:hypothetical protein
LDEERHGLLDSIEERALSGLTRSRLHARRAVVWAAAAPAPQFGPLTLMIEAAKPGQTCLALTDAHRPSPGADDPEAGYVEFAGFAPRTQRLLIVREVTERGRFHRRFEELRLEDLMPVKQASSPELLADFGRWQDVAWRRETLALH